jgi:hypothetical protein
MSCEGRLPRAIRGTDGKQQTVIPFWPPFRAVDSLNHPEYRCDAWAKPNQNCLSFARYVSSPYILRTSTQPDRSEGRPAGGARKPWPIDVDPRCATWPCLTWIGDGGHVRAILISRRGSDD